MPKDTFSEIIEIKIGFKSSPGLSDILRSLLENNGFSSSEIIESYEEGKPFLSLYAKNPTQAQKMYARICALNVKNLNIVQKKLFKSDWQDKWKVDFKPFFLTPKIEIIPIWLKGKYHPKRKFHIYIDTSWAFGTGLHDTTRFMAHLIERSRGQFHSFIDIGTGTGLLAMVAYAYGCRKIAAMDIDPICIKVAKNNFKENNVKGIALKCSDLKNFGLKEKFDFVAANLITQDLIAMRYKILSFVKKGGYLAVSGIGAQNFQNLKKVYATLPLKRVEILESKQWKAVLFKRI